MIQVNGVPVNFKLSQNYPNPFNPFTTIEFNNPKRQNVKISVYDILGNVVAVLINETMNNGIYKIGFDSSNLSSGTYYYRLETESYNDTKKMILIK